MNIQCSARSEEANLVVRDLGAASRPPRIAYLDFASPANDAKSQ
jgi:hypothetical protein